MAGPASGESVRDRRRLLERVHEQFVGATETSEALQGLARAALRPVVLHSWMRSHQRTIDPDRVPDQLVLTHDELAELRRIHPLGRVLPVVRRLLLDEANDSGFIVAVGDAEGRLLWVDGDSGLRSDAENMGFVAGADWSEAAVGTSAPGSALALNHSIQVLGAEHYNRSVHQWSCTAAPVHDPSDGSIIGVIDVTGGDEAAAPHLLPLVEATLAAVEAELQLAALQATIERERTRGGSLRSRAVPQRAPRLLVLGRDPAMLESSCGSFPLSGRHAEILLALSAAPHGLSAAELAEQVYGDRNHESTLRPELVRLRKWLCASEVDLELESRPYRLSSALRVDAGEVLSALSRGAHRLALAAYEGSALPFSDAPLAESLRADVDATLREAMLQSAGAELLFEYAQHWADEDAEVWHTLLTILPPLSPRRARVVAKLQTMENMQR
ncbi:transcriptional regulator [Leucobacter coleopterorum]|uniref:Transcriptional regulator n=1 Tax=Leucobacter coleopterorum TaxID=2714933 RepID=A0ABX6JVG5_9MICO|nr:GAF domain-containing protein [Leucobacter coleopterorum]QIM18296.1 transcriptional regulator [Leucobacter coleopterorum]